MRTEHSLRRRIVIAFALLACVVCGFFSVVVYLAFESIEDYLFGRRMDAEIRWLVKNMKQGKSLDIPPGRRLYDETTAPEFLRGLEPGYHDLERGRATLHVLFHVTDTKRYYLVSDESDFDNLEEMLYLSLAVGCVACFGLSIWLGRLTAGRVIAPVTDLATAIARNPTNDELPWLSAKDEIGELARAFAARSTELRGYLERERLFTGDVSHELRTPLTVILGAAELICAQTETRTAVHTAAQRIRRSTTDMTERVEAFLLLSRAPNTIESAPIRLNALVERELERCQSLAAGKLVKSRIQANGDVYARARPELAAIAIGNLIGNAFRYTERGHVTISLEPGRLVVEDSGPGLPPSVRTRLFERFVRAGDERTTGSGLGLAIVKRVTDHLGWDIKLETPRDGGSRFIITFASLGSTPELA